MCFFSSSDECLEFAAVVTGLVQGCIERLTRLDKHNGTRQKANGKKGSHPEKKLNSHAGYVTCPLEQDQ